MSTGCTSGAWQAPWESTSGGVSDWYLPSSDELITLSASFERAGVLLKAKRYWSSTQESSPYVVEGAYARTLTVGLPTIGRSDKSYTWQVRAVRAF
jgi:hypothetical protein